MLLSLDLKVLVKKTRIHPSNNKFQYNVLWFEFDSVVRKFCWDVGTLYNNYFPSFVNPVSDYALP